MATEERLAQGQTGLVKLYILSLVLLLFYGGCASDRGTLFFPPDALRAWPEPPERPRIRYLGTISTEADLKRGVSLTQGLGELLFGKKEIGVLVAPYAVATDQDNRLFVADTAGAVVHVFDLNRRTYRQFADLLGQEKLLQPVSLTIVDNWVYVVDSILRKVCVFDKNGRFIFSFGGGLFARPSGIAYWPGDKTVYVTDTAGHNIQVFTREGRFIQKIGSRGLSPGMFNFPTHLCVDKAGALYVSDTLNYRIQVLTREGKLIRMFGRQGDLPGYFAHPCGVATDSFGNIYVTDRQFENVQIFNRQGDILMAFGEEGTQAGQFWLPAGIFIDDRNRIYVADSFNKRIQIFELLEKVEK
jgi:DNA-binding beta-propeller fold protein YncE